MLQEITPVLLTFNEAPNLDRTLAALNWAQDIIIVDSFSADETLEIAKRHPRVRLLQRAFDSHAGQWNFATQQTNIQTDWIMALDADYVLSPDLVEELRRLRPDETTVGYRAAFRYLVAGVPLRGTLYPPVTVLFRRGRGSYFQDGHTQRLKVDGNVENLKTKIDHDNRKSLSHWLMSQDRYTRLEAEHLRRSAWSELSVPDKIRRFPGIAPFLVFAYCYLGKGVFLNGKYGLFYALQRLLVEVMIALRLIESKFERTLTNRHHRIT